MRSSQGFWGKVGKGHLFKGNRGRKCHKRLYLGTGNMRKQIFDLGEQGNMPIYFWGTRELVPPGRASNMSTPSVVTKQNLEKSDL